MSKNQKKFHPMRNALAVLLGGLLLLGSQTGVAQSNAVSLDRVVAIVDKDVVLESELNARKQSVLERLQGQYQQLPPEDVLNKQILEQLIIERIELGLAERFFRRFIVRQRRRA